MNEKDRLKKVHSNKTDAKPVKRVLDKKIEGKGEVEVVAMNAVSSRAGAGAGAGLSPLLTAAITGDLEAMKVILEDSPHRIEKSVKGHDAIHARDKNGWQAMHEAARCVFKVITSILFTATATVTFKHSNTIIMIISNNILKTLYFFVFVVGTAIWQ